METTEQKQTVARNLDSLFEAHGHQAHVDAHADVEGEPDFEQQALQQQQQPSETPGSAPSRVGRRYPSSPPSSSANLNSKPKHNEPAVTALGDASSKLLRPPASNMVERMEALRDQLMRVSSTLSGVQERAASLTATLERSRKSLLHGADTAAWAPNTAATAAAAAAPTPSTLPRAVTRPSPYTDAAGLPLSAAAAAAAAARVDGGGSGLEPGTHVYTVTVTAAKSPDVSPPTVGSSGARDGGRAEGPPPSPPHPPRHPFELGSPTGSVAYVALAPTSAGSADSGAGVGGDTEPEAEVSSSPVALKGDSCDIGAVNAALGPAGVRHSEDGCSGDVGGVSSEEQEEVGLPSDLDSSLGSDGAFAGALATLRRGGCPGNDGGPTAVPPAVSADLKAPPQAAAAAAGVAAVTLASAFVRQLGSPVVQELMQRGPAAGPHAFAGCDTDDATSASWPSSRPPAGGGGGEFGAAGAADPAAALLPLLTAAEGSLELMRARRRRTLDGSGSSGGMPSGGGSLLLTSPKVMLTFDSEAADGAAAVVPVTAAVYDALAPPAAATTAEAEAEPLSPARRTEASFGMQSRLGLGWSAAQREGGGGAAALTELDAGRDSDGSASGSGSGAERSDASLSEEAEDSWLRRVDMGADVEDEEGEGDELDGEEAVSGAGGGSGGLGFTLGGSAAGRGGRAGARPWAGSGGSGGGGGGGRRYYDGYSEEDGEAGTDAGTEASEDAPPGGLLPLPTSASAPVPVPAPARRLHGTGDDADGDGDRGFGGFSLPSPSTSEPGDRPAASAGACGAAFPGSRHSHSLLRSSVSVGAAVRSDGGGSARSSASGYADGPVGSASGAFGTPDSGAGGAGAGGGAQGASPSSLRPGWCRIVVPSSPRSSIGGWSAPSPVPSPYTYGVVGVRTPSSGGAAPFSLRKHLDLTVSSCLFGDSESDDGAVQADASTGGGADAAGAGMGPELEAEPEVEAEPEAEEVEEDIEEGDVGSGGEPEGWLADMERDGESSTGSCAAGEA